MRLIHIFPYFIVHSTLIRCSVSRLGNEFLLHEAFFLLSILLLKHLRFMAFPGRRLVLHSSNIRLKLVGRLREKCACDLFGYLFEAVVGARLEPAVDVFYYLRGQRGSR